MVERMMMEKSRMMLETVLVGREIKNQKPKKAVDYLVACGIYFCTCLTV